MVARGGSSAWAQNTAVGMNSDEGFPVQNWWRGVAGELHGVTAKLARGSGWLG